MRVLGIDTCGAEGSVAAGILQQDGVTVLAEERMPGRSVSERLVREVGRCCAAAGWHLGQVEAVVAVRGPGSFTGVRVGMSAAKGLVEACEAGLVTISRLELLARQVDQGGPQTRVWAVLDAGRGEVFCGVMVDRLVLHETLLTTEEFLATVAAGESVVACEPAVLDRLAGLAGLVAVEPPQAVEALRLALDRVLRREFEDTATADAFYLRRTETEIAARVAAHQVAVREGHRECSS